MEVDEVYAPKPVYKNNRMFNRSISNIIKRDTQKSCASITSSTCSSSSTQEISFQEFENGLEHDISYQEISQIFLNDNPFEQEIDLQPIKFIQRPKNPFYKNFSSQEF